MHGIPSPTTVLADGDLISIDCGAILEGWHGDAAVTVAVGTPRPADESLSAACRAAMYAGIERLVPGGRLGDVSHAVEDEARRRAAADGREYGIVADYGGHGIGTSMHMDPFVPNLGRAGTGMRLRSGMVLAIEPMLTGGTDETDELADGWTVVTSDGSRAVHWEHSVAVTDDGPRILTAPPEPTDRIAELSAPCYPRPQGRGDGVVVVAGELRVADADRERVAARLGRRTPRGG